MKTKDKHQITELLQQYIANSGMSQQQIANSIGISATTINFCVKKKWEGDPSVISDKMWNRLAAYLGYTEEWIVVETDKNIKRIMKIASVAQRECVAKAIIGEPGLAKSEALKTYRSKHANVYRLECAIWWTPKVFLQELRREMGINSTALSIPDMYREVVAHLKKTTRPLVIIDEADKLKDSVLPFFVDLYNKTLGRCGFVLCGAPYLKGRIDKGVRLNKQAYKEIYSRIGKEFLPIHNLDQDRITAICQANGITDMFLIQRVANEADNDLRRVKNSIQTIKLELSAKQEAA